MTHSGTTRDCCYNTADSSFYEQDAAGQGLTGLIRTGSHPLLKLRLIRSQLVLYDSHVEGPLEQ